MEKGVLKVSSSNREKFRVTVPEKNSGEVRLGKIPFSAGGSPILDCRTATNSQL